MCPFGATCYRKNLLHFAEFSHPFNLLNPADNSSDEEDIADSAKKKDTITDVKKRKAESEDEDIENQTEEYNSDDVS